MRLRAVIVLGLVRIGAGLRPAHPAQPLTQSLVMDRLGVTLRHPDGWFATLQDERAWMVNAPLAQATGAALNGLAQIFVTVEHRTDHADAVARLRDIASEFEGPVSYLMIGGWPAMQRRVITIKEQPGAQGAPAEEKQILRITTAIAAGDLLIRAEGRMPPDAGIQLEQEVLAIESGMAIQTAGNEAEGQRDIEELRATPKLAPMQPPPSQVKPAAPLERHGTLDKPRLILQGALAQSEPESEPRGPEHEPDHGADAATAAGQVITGALGKGFASEPEIAVSTDGKKIIAGQQFRFAISNDGGLTFPFTGKFPSSTGGDTSLAHGRNYNFYEGTINDSSLALNVLATDGQNFLFRANAFTCPMMGDNQCGFIGPDGAPIPDQGHIAADQFNESASGDDQVYFTLRQGNGFIFTGCSTDGGRNFGAPKLTAGDFPRITVAKDGFVYVVYVNGGNVTLTKYSSCNSRFIALAGWPVTVASGIGVTCPVPGLDRCNIGNQLSSPMVAVDSINANHIYVAYAQSSGSEEKIVLQDSDDGGQRWRRSVTLNASSTARRFMPWLCTWGGIANVTWYDRRAATSTNNDLTDYYGANACVTGSGNLRAGVEFQINALASPDAQCLAGRPLGSAESWPAGSRAAKDSTSCSQQPQLGGRCTLSLQACNFAAAMQCPANETCAPGPGVPKYGDYNGNTCAAGRLYTVWASATPPPGQAPTGNVDLYFASNPIPNMPGCPKDPVSSTLAEQIMLLKWLAW
jgi:hypothetical protein